MNKEAWLQLSDYSNKYDVSVSTLRRRIKSGDVEFQFEDGKYWLADRPIEKYVRQKTKKSVNHPPVQAKPETQKIYSEPEFPVQEKPEPTVSTENFITREEILEITHSMISELKSAYVLVLQEKEAAILQAKKEVADLKTLCQTLESENERLKAESSTPLSGWFLDEEMEGAES